MSSSASSCPSGQFNIATSGFPSGFPSGLPTASPSINYSLYMIIPSALSVAGSASVVLTFIVFKSYIRKKAYMEILFYIFISNMLTALGSVVGLPADGSNLCWFQGITTNIFSLSSCLWTIQIPILLLHIMNSKNHDHFTVPLHAHLLSWGIPLIATFTPLSNARYGSPPGWCWIVETEKTPAWGMSVWFWVSYYLWIWLTLILLVFLFSYIEYRLLTHDKSLESFHPMFHDLAGYNLIIFICWVLPCANDFLLSYQITFSTLMIPAYVLPTSMGFLGSILFWYRAATLRQKWLNLLRASTRRIFMQNTLVRVKPHPSINLSICRAKVAADLGGSHQLYPIKLETERGGFELSRGDHIKKEDKSGIVENFTVIPETENGTDKYNCMK